MEETYHIDQIALKLTRSQYSRRFTELNQIIFVDRIDGAQPTIFRDGPNPMDRLVAATGAILGHTEDPMAPNSAPKTSSA